MQHAFGRSTSQVDQATILNGAQTAKSKFPFSNLAFIAAQFAGNAVVLSGWLAWKTEFLASDLVTCFNVWVGIGEIVDNAIPTSADRFCYERGIAVAKGTFRRL